MRAFPWDGSYLASGPAAKLAMRPVRALRLLDAQRATVRGWSKNSFLPRQGKGGAGHQKGDTFNVLLMHFFRFFPLSKNKNVVGLT
jgi:hypothetical protein